MSNIIQENQILIFTLLSVIVFTLATYLGFVLNKVKVQNKINKLHLQEIEQLRIQRELSIKESIRILAKAVRDEQCEISEGCIRIVKLCEIIDLQNLKGFDVFNELYQEIKDFPFLEQRESLSKQEKFGQDNKRFAIEQKYEKRIKSACGDILNSLHH